MRKKIPMKTNNVKIPITKKINAKIRQSIPAIVFNDFIVSAA
jgi:hypothetical protein